MPSLDAIRALETEGMGIRWFRAFNIFARF